VELLGAIVDAVAALAFGFYFARLWAPAAGWSVLIGLVCGGVCAVIYFGASVLTGELVPHLFDAQKVGYWFMILVFAAPVLGAIGAFFGYRRMPHLDPL
jgi:hypothetical protein